jgi:chlorobactene glucosyltransferase
MFFLFISTVFFLAAVVIIYWLHNQNQLDILTEPSPLPSSTPMISICVPARNEEHNIQRCIESLLAQDYPNFEVIVLDDRSTDATAEILRRLVSVRSPTRPSAAQADKLRIVHGSDLPSGWAGKPHALYQAAKVARGEWLCFVDADTFLSQDTLTACLVKANETGADLFTIMTFQIMETFWEKTVMPLVMTALSVGFSPRKVNDPQRRDAIANGQFIMIKRRVYDAIGGHEKVKDQIVEDKAISELVKWNGYRLIVADGSKVAKTRMYTSLPSMWEGWTKNIYLGLRNQPALLWLGVFGAFLALTAALFLPAWPLAGVLWYARGGGWMAVAIALEATAVWIFLLYLRARIAKKMLISPFYALTTPLGAAVFAAMMFTSAWKVVSGKGVTWKGRLYAPK